MKRRYWVYKGQLFLGAITVWDWAVRGVENAGFTLTPISGGDTDESRGL